MKTSLYILSLILSVYFCFSCKTEKSQQEAYEDLPNIILLVGDDQGYPYFGFMGSEHVHTPNMDVLAENGIVFTDGYVSDNHCRPSLQTLLTGVLPIDFHKRGTEIIAEEIERNNIAREDVKAFKQDFDRKGKAFPHVDRLPELLAKKGYVSWQGGKWWEYSYQNGGFTHGMTHPWPDSALGDPGWFYKHMGGDGMDLARVSNQAAYDFLEETDGKPFFMWYAPSLPHYPFDAPGRYTSLYEDKGLSESAKLYYANCTWFDDAFGELVGYLKANDLYDNTLFVYVNDNGWEQEPQQEFVNDPMRSHNGGDKGKGSIYDMSFRSPIIFSWEGHIEAGKRSAALMHSADIPATILDYVGVDIPEHFYGISYRPLIEGNTEKLRDFVQGNVITTRSKDPNNVMGDHVEGYWVREGNWFLRWHVDDDELELFDLRVDPFNNVNVAELHPEIVNQLWEKAKAYQAEKGQDPRLAYYRSL